MDVTVFHLVPWQSVEDDIGWPFSNDRFEPEEGSALYETYLSQLAYCEEHGYDAVGLNEHHFSASGSCRART